MSRAVTFTQAQVRRAVKGAESAGLRVRKVTVNPNGSITVETGEIELVPYGQADKALAASWDDV